jgi:hypothetical protein
MMMDLNNTPRNNTYHIYDNNQNLVEIRTRVEANRTSPLFVIQKPVKRENKIVYQMEYVTEERFFMKVCRD